MGQSSLHQFDFRWRDLPASEPMSGMSESLADGLVSRFTAQWKRDDVRSLERAHLPTSMKRAAFFRQSRKFLEESVPSDLVIMTRDHGDQRGLDKRAAYFILHWVPDAETGWLTVRSALVTGRGKYHAGRMTAVSRHALVRLFQRLKTTDDRSVLAEASHAVRNVFPWKPVYRDVLGMPEILVPTPRGAAVFARDDSDTARRTFAKTWMSDSRMDGSDNRIDAVRAARAEEGFVLMANQSFVVISQKRLTAGTSPQAVFDCIRSQVSPIRRSALGS